MNAFKVDFGHRVPVTDLDPLGFNYDTWQKSLIVSILSAGTFFGALASGWLADEIGRRKTIIAGCGVFSMGVIIQVAATDIACLAAGRFVAGLGVGVVSAVDILYMSEIAPRKVRGAIVSAYQFAITLGIMLASCVGFATQNRSDSGAYRIPIAIQFLWAIMLAVGLFLLPESPRYWVKKGRLDNALKCLARVRDQPETSGAVEDELAEIVANCDHERQIGEVSWLQCFSGGIKNTNSNMRKVFIGTALQMMQQWTGVNFIFYYVREVTLLERYVRMLTIRAERHFLPASRHRKPLFDLHDHHCRQRRQHTRCLLLYREIWSPRSSCLGRHRHVHL